MKAKGGVAFIVMLDGRRSAYPVQSLAQELPAHKRFPHWQPQIRFRGWSGHDPAGKTGQIGRK